MRLHTTPLDPRTLALHASSGATLGDLRDALFEPHTADQLTGLIAEAPFPGLALELPALTARRWTAPLEAVLVEVPALASRPPDWSPFRGPLSRAIGPVAVFPNLGRDATLVAPVPQPGADWGHLAAFCRTAPPAVTRALWAAVGQVLHEEVGRRPRWLSTAGLGVSWLHVRLDSRPKYIKHAPYRVA